MIYGICFCFHDEIDMTGCAKTLQASEKNRILTLAKTTWDENAEHRWIQLFTQTLPDGASVKPGPTPNHLYVCFDGHTDERQAFLQKMDGRGIEQSFGSFS